MLPLHFLLLGLCMIKEKVKAWSKLSANLGQFFSAFLPFPPYVYTVLSLLVALAAIGCAYAQCHVLALGLFFVAACCDMIDGAVARARHQASALGAYLDGVTDRFVDFALIFSYFFIDLKTPGLSPAQWICIASFVVMLPSFNVAYANHRKAVEDDHETLIWRLMNRGEMFVLMMLILIVAMFSPVYAGYGLILLIGLSSVTIVQTIVSTLYHASVRPS